MENSVFFVCHSWKFIAEEWFKHALALLRHVEKSLFEFSFQVSVWAWYEYKHVKYAYGN